MAEGRDDLDAALAKALEVAAGMRRRGYPVPAWAEPVHPDGVRLREVVPPDGEAARAGLARRWCAAVERVEGALRELTIPACSTSGAPDS